jgi:ribosomal protein S18 acetylase RimI-like enzyme
MFLQCIEKVPTPGAIRRVWGYVTNSFVDPHKRGHGIGEGLLRLLIGVARDRELEFLIVWPSEAAVGFYLRAGFRGVSDVHVGPDNEPPLELVLPIDVDSSATA